jgi:ABC-type molybdate transport system substrate-binding protein
MTVIIDGDPATMVVTSVSAGTGLDPAGYYAYVTIQSNDMRSDITVNYATTGVPDGCVLATSLGCGTTAVNINYSSAGTVLNNSITSTIPTADMLSLFNPDEYNIPVEFIYGATIYDLVGNRDDVMLEFTVEPPTRSIDTVSCSWGSELLNSEKTSDGTINITTSNLANGRRIHCVLIHANNVNYYDYWESVINNTANVTIPAADLATMPAGTVAIQVTQPFLYQQGPDVVNWNTSFTVTGT